MLQYKKKERMEHKKSMEYAVLYRPFDIQWIFYHDSVVWRTVKRVMYHMMRDNLGMITSRQMDKSGIEPVFVTNMPIDAHSITSAVSISCLFPLYLYPDNKNLFNKDVPQNKTPSIKPKIFSILAQSYKVEPTAESILYYIYAVLYSNIYRTKYAEFLRIDFPRIPFTKDYEIFRKMAEFGQRLVNLHLLNSPELDPPVAKFEGSGENKVKKIKYEEGKVFINRTQYFEGIKPQVWQYQIGGYQVCEKWLKDRKSRILSLDEIKHYWRVITALEKTIKLQSLIDETYSEIERAII
ncbi:MAG: type ISP restriction/modification enzyme [Thermodesulfovibrionaceae bacterium]